MRIVLLNQYYQPADAPTAWLLADVGRALAADGHEVTAICSRRAYADPARRYAPRQELDGVRVVRTPTTGFGRGSRLGRLADYVSFFVSAGLTLLARERPQVVISLTTPPLVGLLGWLGTRRGRARSVLWVMDVYPDVAFRLGMLRPASLAGRALTRVAAFVLHRADEVVALGPTMAERLGAAGARRVSVIHNWADEEAIRPLDRGKNPLRASWGWNDRFVVLYSGNIGLAHEFDAVLEAAALLRERRDVLFAFVGDGPRRREVEARVRQRGLDNVQFRPFVSAAELPLGLTAGDLHLVTLRDGLEGLLVPSKIYGILAAGRPALYVGPERCEVAEILARGPCGVRLAAGDAAGVAETVRAYADDPVRVAREGRLARAVFERSFTRARALREFRALLQRLE